MTPIKLIISLSFVFLNAPISRSVFVTGVCRLADDVRLVLPDVSRRLCPRPAFFLRRFLRTEKIFHSRGSDLSPLGRLRSHSFCNS